MVIVLVSILADTLFGPWHSLVSFHPSSILLIFLFFPALRVVSSKGFNQQATKFAKVCLLQIVICLFYAAAVSTRPAVSSLPLILDVWVQVWPYLKIPVLLIFSMAVVASGLGEWLRKNLFRFALAFITCYLFINISMKQSSPRYYHNAYLAALCVIVVTGFQYQLFSERPHFRKAIWISAVMGGAALLPFYGALRGASMILVLCMGIILFGSPRKTSMRSAVTFVLVSLLVIGPFWSRISPTFQESNAYSYRNPADVLRGFSSSEKTAQERLNWWQEASVVFVRSPFVGTVFSYNTGGVPGVPSQAQRLHNYIASMLLDGGLVLFLPFALLVKYGVVAIISCWKTRRGLAVTSLVWSLVVLLTHFSNGYGHSDYASTPLSLILGTAFATVLLSRCDPAQPIALLHKGLQSRLKETSPCLKPQLSGSLTEDEAST